MYEEANGWTLRKNNTLIILCVHHVFIGFLMLLIDADPLIPSLTHFRSRYQKDVSMWQ
jgi:hypothetical protein